MNTHDAIKNTLNTAEMIAMAYIGDMNDQELMMRPHDQCNHLNWQLGHLIASDHEMVSGCLPGKLPALPDGFKEKYSKENAANNSADAFCTKDELMSLYKQQREGLVQVLDSVSADDLDQATPEPMQSYAPTFGAAFNMVGSHWLMHVGQWVIVRREAGKPIVI